MCIRDRYCRTAKVKLPPQVVVWIASKSSSTDSSRKRLPEHIPLSDVVVNIESTARVLSCFYEGDFENLQSCEDRIHQAARLNHCPESKAVFEKGHEIEGLHLAWLSGAGPSVAFLGTDEFCAALMSNEFPGGKFFSLEPDSNGLVVLDE